MSNIYIIGDSFGAPYDDNLDSTCWYTQLHIDTVNLCQAGAGQYKIYQQLKQINQCDLLVLLITSENRIHCSQNPFYTDKNHRHKNCDLLFGDIENKLPDPRAEHLNYFFVEIFDQEYARQMHSWTLEKTHQLAKEKCKNIIPITFFKPYNDMYNFNKTLIDLSSIASEYPGEYNHLSQTGHNCVTKILKEKINNA